MPGSSASLIASQEPNLTIIDAQLSHDINLTVSPDCVPLLERLVALDYFYTRH